MDSEQAHKIELMLDEKKELPKKEVYLLTIDVVISDISIAKQILSTLLEYKNYIEHVYEVNLRK